MTKSLFFYGEPVPQGPALLDGIDRRIRLTTKGFHFDDGRAVREQDLEWPIRLDKI